MENCIVITRTEKEVAELKSILNLKHENIGFWGRKQTNFDCLWVWTIKQNSPSGSSGYMVLESHIDNDPDLRILTFSQLKKSKP